MSNVETPGKKTPNSSARAVVIALQQDLTAALRSRNDLREQLASQACHIRSLEKEISQVFLTLTELFTNILSFIEPFMIHIALFSGV